MEKTCWNCGTKHNGNRCPDCDCHQSIRDEALLEGKE
jgi:hypothetical protein